MKSTWISIASALCIGLGQVACVDDLGPDLAQTSEAHEALSIVAGYDLINTPASVAIGANATADFVAPNGHFTTDWVGIYPVGGQDSEYLVYAYVPAPPSGTVSITLPATAVAGQNYELRYYLNNTYTLAAVSTSFTATSPAISYSLANVPSFPSLGSTVDVTWNAPSNHSGLDWIGLYPVGGASYQYVGWTYAGPTGQTSGTASVVLGAPAAPGDSYEFRYLLNNGYDIAATSSPFTVGNSLSAPAGPVAAGSSVTTNWNAPVNHSDSDWIGLFVPGAANNVIETYAYVGSLNQASGSIALTVPANAADGQLYEFRYFLNNTYTLAGKSASFAVGAPYTLTGPAGSVLAGTSAAGSWTAPSFHSNTDWIGLYAVGASANAFLGYSYTDAPGATSGVTNVLIPAATAAGMYELRYFTNNSYNAVATSNPFQVTIACAAGFADCDGNGANGCETNIDSDPLHCGGCGVACGVGTCAGAACQVAQVLASGIPTVAYMATDGTSLYLASGGHSNVAYTDGSVQSIPLAGGTPTVLVSNVPSVNGLSFDGTHVYFSSIGNGNFDNGFLGRVLPQGGTYETFAANQPYCLYALQRGQRTYWLNAGTASASWADGAVRVSIAGAASTIATETNPTGVDEGSGFVYWLSGGSPSGGFDDGALRRQPIAGGATETLVTTIPKAGTLIVAGGLVYYAEEDAVTQYDPGPGQVTTFASHPADPGNFATDGTYLYWTQPGAGRVLRKNLAGGSEVVLVDALTQPFALVVDGSYLYISDRGTGIDDGAVLRILR